MDLERELLAEPLPVDAPKVEALARVKTPKAWLIKESVFGPRGKECDSKNYVDTPEVFGKMFELDWSRLQAKRTFAKYCPGDTPVGQGVKEVIKRYYELLAKAYAYYSVMGSGSDESMQLNEYTDLCNELSIPDKSSKYCKLKDVDGIFITAAFKVGGAA